MIEKLYALMAKVGITKGQDKVLHFVAGFGIVAVLFFVFEDYIAFFAMLFFAFWKEVYDKYVKKTEINFFDFFATLLGGMVGLFSAGLLAGLV